MSINTPIFSIAKDLNVESNRILLACKKLGINAKGATKRLNEEELKKIMPSNRFSHNKISSFMINWSNKFVVIALLTISAIALSKQAWA